MPVRRGNPTLRKLPDLDRRLDDHERRLDEQDVRLDSHDRDIADLSDAVFKAAGVMHRAKLRVRMAARKRAKTARARGR